MVPIIAILLSFAALSLQAQQTAPLSPPPSNAPVLMDQTPIPQQSLSQLQQLAQDPVLQPKETGDDVVIHARPESAAPGLETKGKTVLDKDAEVQRLGALPVFNLQTNKAALAEVLTLLTDACQMSYIGLEKGIGENVKISVNISKNPYETLKLLCDRYNVALDYENGIWHFGIYDDEELIARVYHLRYNNQEEVSASGSGGGSSSTGSTGGTGSTGSTGTSSSSTGSSSNGSGSGSSGGGGISSSANASFSINRDVIKTNIETFLTFSSQDRSILTAEDFDVDHLTSVTARGVARVLPKAADGAAGAGGAAANKGKVVYNSDNQSLYVLATKAQHQWIEKYIQSVDKPQKQILIETKMFETSITPDTIMGVSWHNNNSSLSLRDGQPSSGLTALLSGDSLHAVLNLLESDSNTNSVEYPRQVTINNRPVAMASTQQIPIIQGSSSTSVGTGSTTSSAQETTITTGINISILPRIVDGDKVLMDISVTSSELGNEVDLPTGTGGTPSPYYKTTERDYKTQAIIDDGYTLAIGGLKSLSNSDSYSGVPVLSKLPVVGSLFRHREQKHGDSNLLIFISPQILKEYRGGVKDHPEFVIPHDKDYPAKRIFQGTPDESYTDIMLSLAGMEHQLDECAQHIKEGMDLNGVKSQLDGTENELKLMEVRLKEIALEQPNKDISEANQKIHRYLRNLHELRGSISKHQNIAL